jgi:hypothetical protein
MTRPAGRPSTLDAARLIAGLAATVALLAPWPLSAESSLVSGAKTSSAGASAHLDFKIIIPPVLALSVEPAGSALGAPPRVSILSNTRHVLLTASAPESPDGHAVSAAGAHGTLFLGARRGSMIVTESACRRDPPRVVALGTRRSAPIVDLQPVVCTVTMP